MKRSAIVTTSTHVVRDGNSASSRGFSQVDQLLSLSSKGPLGEEEQERLLREFERLQWSNTRQWRMVFGVLAAALACFWGWAAWEQHMHPFGQRWTGELSSVSGSADPMTAVLMLQAASLAVTALGLLQHMPPPGELERGCMPASQQQWLLLLLGTAGNCVGASFWLHAHYRMIQKFGYALGARWELLWVPLLPVSFTLAACWVLYTLGSTAQQVTALRGLKYTLKKV